MFRRVCQQGSCFVNSHQLFKQHAFKRFAKHPAFPTQVPIRLQTKDNTKAKQDAPEQPFEYYSEQVLKKLKLKLTATQFEDAKQLFNSLAEKVESTEQLLTDTSKLAIVAQIIKSEFLNYVKELEETREKGIASFNTMIKDQLVEGDKLLKIPSNSPLFYDTTNSFQLARSETYPANKYNHIVSLIKRGAKSNSCPGIVLAAVSGSGKSYLWYHLAKHEDMIPIVFNCPDPLADLFEKKGISASSEKTKQGFFKHYFKYMIIIADYLQKSLPEQRFFARDFVTYTLNGGSNYLATLYSRKEIYTLDLDDFVPIRKDFVIVFDEAAKVADDFILETKRSNSDLPMGNGLTVASRAARSLCTAVFAGTKFSEKQIRALVSGSADGRGSTRSFYKPLPAIYTLQVADFINKFVFIDKDLPAMRLISFFLQGRIRFIECMIQSMHSELVATHALIQALGQELNSPLAWIGRPAYLRTFLKTNNALARFIDEATMTNEEAKNYFSSLVEAQDGQPLLRSDIVLQLLLFGFVNETQFKDDTDKEIAFAGVTYSQPFREELAFMTEPTMVYLLQNNASWSNLCSLNNVKLKEFLMRSFVHSVMDVRKKAREVFTLLCILQHKTAIQQIMKQHQAFSEYIITSDTILHDHEIDKALNTAGELRASSIILNELCNATIETPLSKILAKCACFPLEKLRADAILFAKRLSERRTDLPLYMPIVISMNAFTDEKVNNEPLCENEKLEQDYMVTNVANFYSRYSGTEESSPAAALNHHAISKTMKKIGKYIRIIVHPWLSSSKTQSLSSIVAKVDKTNHEELNTSDAFSMLNSEGHLVIRICSDSKFVEDWRKQPNIVELMKAAQQ